MLRIFQTFNAHNVNDGSNYKAWLINPDSLPAAQPVYVSQVNADSEDVGAFTVEAQTLAVRIKIENYANRNALIAQLYQWFKRGTLGDAVVTFTDDGLNYYKPSRVVNLVRDPEFPMYFTALLQTGWTTWRAVIANIHLEPTAQAEIIRWRSGVMRRRFRPFRLSGGTTSRYLYQQYYQLLTPQRCRPGSGRGASRSIRRRWWQTIQTNASSMAASIPV
jgi:hypothetical protein